MSKEVTGKSKIDKFLLKLVDFLHAERDESAARIPCLSPQRLCLSVPDCAPPHYKTVPRTVLLNARCPHRLRIPFSI